MMKCGGDITQGKGKTTGTTRAVSSLCNENLRGEKNMDQTNTDQALNEADKNMKARLKELTDKWLLDNDDSSFANAVAVCQKLNELDEIIFGYQMCAKLKTLVVIIIDYVSKKHSTPKNKQQIKEKLKEIQRICNDYEANKDEKEQAISEIIDKIENLLLEIIELVKG